MLPKKKKKKNTSGADLKPCMERDKNHGITLAFIRFFSVKSFEEFLEN